MTETAVVQQSTTKASKHTKDLQGLKYFQGNNKKRKETDENKLVFLINNHFCKFF